MTMQINLVKHLYFMIFTPFDKFYSDFASTMFPARLTTIAASGMVSIKWP